MGKGFFARGMGWVGPQPITPEREREIEAANQAVARERAAELREAARPVEERTRTVKLELLRQIPPELVRELRTAAATVDRLALRNRETQAALSALLATEPAECNVDAFLAERFRLEQTLPILKGLHGKAVEAQNAALAAARSSIHNQCGERTAAASDWLAAFEREQQSALKDVQLTARIEREGASRARWFTLADLAELEN